MQKICTFAPRNFDFIMVLTERIFSIKTSEDFQNVALAVFRYQYKYNPVYQSFCNYLNRNPEQVNSVNEIPFLPIEFFKTKTIISGTQKSSKIFTSSGTTGSNTSKHYVKDISIYEKSFRQGFRHFYANETNYAFLALLPAYLERTGSSLIYMVDDLIKRSKNTQSGFFLHNLDQLAEKLHFLEETEQKTILIGVSFALLDLVEKYNFSLKNTIVMETGGMKGRRKELIREDLHHILKQGFGTESIHSEYGMTELLSQAYSSGNGIFRSVPWMQNFNSRCKTTPYPIKPFW
ncbi:Acyl-protein synthetase [Capnocytophaga canimorsus]|nr:Acyl-protein synthetase [Capnocytophaga canimorsus]